MFGYIVGDQTMMEKEEAQRYRSFYCGLCRELKDRYGGAARLSLTYDMTFLILFLSSMYEPEESSDTFRCAVHPVRQRTEVRNRYTEYAADLSVVLVYYKCMDDWEDEKKRTRLFYANILKKDYPAVLKKWPRQCEAIESSMKALSEQEQKEDVILDDLAKIFGKMMGELFVYQEQDYWAETLRSFGDYLGRFIYVMDAVMDLDKDQEHGRINPLSRTDWNFEKMEGPLTLLIGKAAEQFERLPLVQDSSILQNILYSGAWRQYRMKQAKRSGKDDT